MYMVFQNQKLKVNEMKGFFKRLKGLMFVLTPINEGYLFNKCNSIHTFFMCQPIDIIMLDNDNKIIKMYQSFDSEKIIWPKKKVAKVLELPVGTCKYFSIGDTIKIIS